MQQVKDDVVYKLTGMFGLKDEQVTQQLFYMNTDQAIKEHKAGMVSAQYEKLLFGMKEFFTIGHRQKLLIAYKSVLHNSIMCFVS